MPEVIESYFSVNLQGFSVSEALFIKEVNSVLIKNLRVLKLASHQSTYKITCFKFYSVMEQLTKCQVC